MFIHLPAIRSVYETRCRDPQVLAFMLISLFIVTACGTSNQDYAGQPYDSYRNQIATGCGISTTIGSYKRPAKAAKGTQITGVTYRGAYDKVNFAFEGNLFSAYFVNGQLVACGDAGARKLGLISE